MEPSARRLATLVPALLCALWSLILTPAPASASDPAPATRTAAISQAPAPATRTAAISQAPAVSPALPVPAATPRTAPASVPASAPAHRLVPPEPHLAPAAVAGLPAAVEHSVRFPAAPAAPVAAPADLFLPPRGLLVGDPRRERAPPGGSYVPRDPRGPPSTRHR
ncbi:hypothetical protein ACFQ7A_19745 [Streptomyces sp. NPDC056528]|uniref:hypothetical protein n=1 Tax=Streptomyces sp. NPDC056528 TaxID=3345854 RepID=UPI0036C1781D